ncbi:PARP-domain-containing protein [Corynespora cassiicola Philippines]|uniref:Poly [ADP-ribose] polymerase n=1 Tax=Corynespora cassiicola Philippines TaxID=1448308 RepID=A0A2T2PAU6_CORCC|nr:PARP-domain-containing protein [Corynespora cassiicola Philippines]
MARKPAPKAAPAPALDGSAIAVSGRFPGTNQSALQKRITSLGATFSPSISPDTTHLIVTEKEYGQDTTKVKAAKDSGIPIVTIEWLDECETSNSKADETSYMLNAPPAPVAAQNGSKKRAASPDLLPAAAPSAAQPAKKQKKEPAKPQAQVGDGQNAKSSSLIIPLDEACPLATYQVYIDPTDGTIFDASLNQTNATANNNKFYRVQLLRNAATNDFKTWTRWGRVGERGQNAILGNGSLDDAVKNFEKKFKDKSGLKWSNRGVNPKPGKYAYVEKSYNPDSEDEEPEAENEVEEASKAVSRQSVKCTLDDKTRRLIELIFNQQYFADTMAELNYDANKLPLGKLSKGTINRGFQALKDLAALLNDPTLAASQHGMAVHAAVEQLSNAYYSLIPHAFGRNRPPVIRTDDLLKREIDLLESLGDMKEAAALMKSNLKDHGNVHPLDRQFQGLGMEEMVPLDPRSGEFNELANYLTKTKAATHYVNYEVEDIFRIQRQGEFERFEKSGFDKIPRNRRLLWHGSRVTNFGGILGQGLRIAPPEAPVSGYMFGKGIYLADMSSKSANYCCSSTSGGTALLLLCEAELGNPMQELLNASYSAGEDAKAKGLWSTWGRGQTGPSKWKDAKCVHPALAGCQMPDVSVPPGNTNVAHKCSLLYNEYICYDVAQVRLRYLLRVRMS